MKNKLIYYFIVIFFISTTSKANFDIDAKTAILQDYLSGEILYQKDPDLSIYPASMTKIMTSIIAFDLIEKGDLSFDEKFMISENAWRLSQSGYSSMFIMVGDMVSVEDLLKGIIIVSGNDACVALAEGIAGSEEEFAVMMTSKAKEIGMDNTNFSNSSGINDPDNYSTVRDILIMSNYLIKNYPEFYEMYKEKEFTWDRTGGDPITQGNRNPLLYKNIGADGIKTGYLAVEKYSLASSMIGKDRRLIAVGSGFLTKQARSDESARMFRWALRNTNTYEIAKKDEPKFKFKTWLGKEDFVEGVVKEDIYVTIFKKEIKNFKVFLEYNGPLKAPIKKDQEIGNLVIEKPDDEIIKFPIYSSKKVKKVNFFKSLFFSFNYMIWGDA